MVSLDRYADAMETAAHFRSKSSNSNAELAVIRCPPDEALDLPYVSLRCLLGGGRDIPLDGGAGGNTAVSMVRQCIDAATNAPETEGNYTRAEREACAKILEECRGSGVEWGTNFVDPRLGMVLLPRPDGVNDEEDTVCVTPLTSTSVTAMLLAWETGVVAQHDAAVVEQRKKAKSEGGASEAGGVDQLRRLRRAHMPYGGANPINVSRFTSTLHRPLMLDSPSPTQAARRAWKLYFNGLRLADDMYFRRAAGAYAKFLRRERYLHEERKLHWTMQHRVQERALVSKVAQSALDAGARALALLKANSGFLPRHKFFDDGQAHLVSPSLPAWVRGLIDPRLRDAGWPAQAAAHIEVALREQFPPMSPMERGAVKRIIEGALS